MCAELERVALPPTAPRETSARRRRKQGDPISFCSYTSFVRPGSCPKGGFADHLVKRPRLCCNFSPITGCRGVSDEREDATWRTQARLAPERSTDLSQGPLSCSSLRETGVAAPKDLFRLSSDDRDVRGRLSQYAVGHSARHAPTTRRIARCAGTPFSSPFTLDCLTRRLGFSSCGGRDPGVGLDGLPVGRPSALLSPTLLKATLPSFLPSLLSLSLPAAPLRHSPHLQTLQLPHLKPICLSSFLPSPCAAPCPAPPPVAGHDVLFRSDRANLLAARPSVALPARQPSSSAAAAARVHL